MALNGVLQYTKLIRHFSDSNPYSGIELNFSMVFNIIAPYMEMLQINRSLHHWFVLRGPQAICLNLTSMEISSDC